MTDAIKLSTTSGRYGELLRKVVINLNGRGEQGQAGARLLDLMVHISSEHTLSFAVRSIRARAVPKVNELCPCDAALRVVAGQLAQRDDAQDEVVSRIVLLMAELISEYELALMLTQMDAVRAKKAAEFASGTCRADCLPLVATPPEPFLDDRNQNVP